jgi:uncharacterized protein YraI
MKYRMSLAAAAWLAAMLPAASLAQDAVATTDLNMRAGPGPQFPVISTISADGGVDIHGCTASGRWCDVTAGSMRGWAYAEYLAFDMSGTRVVLPQATTQVQVPTVTYETATYWDTYYRDQPFYAEREQYVTVTEDSGMTTATGAIGGAATGAVLGGPIGAAIGGVAGAVIGAAAEPPPQVTTYVTQQPGAPVMLQGEVVVGAGLPDTVQLVPVPDYQYQFAYVNGQRVLVDPATRQVVYIYR